MAKLKFLKVPILIYKVKNHNKLKDVILYNIDKMGNHSLNEKFNEHKQASCISNTDWHLDSNLFRPYYDTICPIIKNNINVLKRKLKLNCDLNLVNYWFQQYQNGDYHEWHNHYGYYSSIYYVELPKDSVKTTFKIMDKKYEFEVTEGDIISFPSMLYHKSKPNKSNKRKTIVSFNLINLNDE